MMGATGTLVEMDECFIGGNPKNMHASRRLKLRVGGNGYAEKTAIFGMQLMRRRCCTFFLFFVARRFRS